MNQSDLLPGLTAEAETDGNPPLGDESARGREALSEGRFGEAAECFERAVAGKSLAETDDLLGLAEARLWQGRYGDVERTCLGILEREPGQRDVRALYGIALAHLDDPAAAVAFLHKAPEHPAVHLGMALALGRLGRFSESEHAIRRALAMAADFPGALRELGTILAHQRRHGEALAAFGKALKLDPDDAPTRLALAHVRLTLGNASAWSEVDWRLKVAGFTPAFPPVGPAWDGASAAGKTLLLIAEPSPGDQIMFIRYASMLKLAGARVVLACPAEMAELLSGAEGVDRVVTDPAALDERIDAHAYLMSLPGLTHVPPDEFPRGPYLNLDPTLTARWAAEVAALPGNYKVAIHWGGGAADRTAVPLESFATLASLPGVRLISVQKGPGAAEASFPLTDYGRTLDIGSSAFVEAAAILKGVDLVVTNDRPIAHLAGALGVPTWVALPVGPDWRWLVDRHDSPWYPGVRLFRQELPDDWSSVFNAMESMLRAGVAIRSSALRSA